MGTDHVLRHIMSRTNRTTGHRSDHPMVSITWFPCTKQDGPPCVRRRPIPRSAQVRGVDLEGLAKALIDDVLGICCGGQLSVCLVLHVCIQRWPTCVQAASPATNTIKTPHRVTSPVHVTGTVLVLWWGSTCSTQLEPTAPLLEKYLYAAYTEAKCTGLAS